MRKISFFLILFLFIGNIYSQNLVPNGGFEIGSLSPWAPWNPGGTASLSNGNAHTGTYSVQLNGGECSIEQVVSGLRPNTTYHFSGWCKLANAQNVVAIGAKNFGGTNANISFSSTTYEQKSFSFTTGASNTTATIFIYKAPGGSGIDYGDDLQLIEPVAAPTADFSVNPRTILIGGAVTLTDLSTQRPTSWEWSFPGGTPAASTLKSPTVSYATAGTFNVVLTSTNATGSSAPLTKTAYINVVDISKSSTYYISNSTGSDDNDGKTPATAWKTLSKVNSTTFNPRDTILFKCGDVWNGQLKPKGSGLPNYPIVIDMYGTYTDKASKPHIQAQGLFLKAVHLYNIEYWELNNLQISNFNATGYKDGLTGFGFEVDNYGVAHHLHAKKLYIHDVNGNNTKNPGPGTEGYGILWNNHGTIISTFDDLLIEDCYLEKTDRNAIMGWGYTDRRNWHPSTNVVIRRNSINNVGGDGIVILGTNKALVEYNIVNRFRMRPPGAGDPSAGIWPVHADSTLIQYNEACYGYGSRDGMGFDADANCRGSIFQYNYSHNNDGGFMLIINYESAAEAKMTGTIIRYNVSVNDGAYAKRLIQMAGKYDNCTIYNNTFYMGQGTDIKVLEMDSYPDGYTLNTVFDNNIFYVANGVSATYSATGTTNLKFNNNVFYGTHKNLSLLVSNPNISDPKFVSPGSSAFGLNTLEGYKLQNSSPLIGAGKLISNNGGKDYWGNVVGKSANPTIGAYEFSSLASIPTLSMESDLIQVYPVPARDHFTVNSKLSFGAEYTLVDFSGKTFASGQLSRGENSLNSSQLNNGIYFLNISCEGKNITKAVMVNK